MNKAVERQPYLFYIEIGRDIGIFMKREEINRIKEECTETARFFYQGQIEKGYSLLNALIEKLLELINDLQEEKEQMCERTEEILRLQNVLKEALAAMEEQDTVLLADLLQYELQEIL